MIKFKNFIISTALSILILLGGPVTEKSLAAPVKVKLDNNFIEMQADPIIKNGRTLVPLRGIFEPLGANVKWDSRNKKATGILDDKTVVIQINNKKALVNGKEVLLDVPGEIINGHTYVPLRFIGESFGLQVDFKDGIVSINQKPQNPHKLKQYKVVRVVDGDTYVISFNGKDEKIRIIGVDTPESVHSNSTKNVPEGKIASDYVKNLLDGKTIGLEFDVQERDKYGRLLGYVYLGETMINKHLLEEGYAKLATFPPNVKYVDELTQIQTKARDNNKGFWKNNAFTSNTENKNSNTSSKKEEQRKTSGKYIGSISSDKFHKPSCKWAKNIKSHNETWFSDYSDATTQGYSPCGVCKP